MMAEPLRIGLLGAGMISVHHLAAWSRIEEVSVVGIADSDINRARTRAEAFSIPAAFSSAEDLIAATRPDALDIATPVETHGPLCRLVAAHGIDILCQKPLAADHAEATAIVEDVGARVRFMVHENWRFRPSYRQVRAWLDNDRIGALRWASMCVESSGLLPDGAGRLPALERQPFLAMLPRLLVFEVLIHHVDVLQWLFGNLSVLAARLLRGSAAVRGEDTAAILFETAQSAPVQLSASMTVAGAPAGIADHFVIVGSEGVIRLSPGSVEIRGRTVETREWSFEELYTASFEGALRAFVQGIRSGQIFETEASDNLRVLQVVDNIYEADAGS